MQCRLRPRRYLRRSVLVALACAAIAAPATAQAPPGPKPIPNPRSWANDFLQALQQQPAKAYDFAKQAGLQPVGAERLQRATLELIRANGAVIGANPIGEEHVGATVMRLSYLVLHERGAAVYYITFYQRPDSRVWQLYAIEVIGEPGRFPFKPGPPAL